MKFSAKNSDLAAFLAKGLKFTEKCKSVGIIVDKKSNNAVLRLLDESGAYYHARFPAKIESSGSFSISLDVLQSLTKAKSLEIEYVADNKLHVRSLNSRMTGKDVPLLTDPVILAEPVKGGVGFGKTQSKALLMMSESAISSFFQKVLPQYILAEKGTLTVATADVMTSAIATTPAEKLNISEFSIPAQYAKLMREVVGDDCTIVIRKDKLIVTTDLLHIQLPMLQVDTIAKVGQIISLDNSKTTCSFSVESHTLRGDLDNIVVVYEEKAPLKLRVKNTLTMEYRTNHGNFTTSLKIEDLKGTAELHVDIEMFQSLIARMNGKISVQVKESCIVLKCSPMKNMTIKYVIAQVHPGE